MWHGFGSRKVRRSPGDEWWPPRKGYAILYKANSLRFTYFSSTISDWDGLRVLDVGCGGGYTCEFLARRGATVFGTDISETSLQAARRHAGQSGLSIEYRLGTEGSLPFSSGAMDVVTCFEVLEHVRDVRPMLSEIHRVLRPAGRLFLDTVNRTFWSKVIAIWLGEALLRLIEPGTHDWRLFIEPEEIKHRLQASGFTDIGLAGLRIALPSLGSGGLPLRIDRRGKKAVVYFGSAVRQ